MSTFTYCPQCKETLTLQHHGGQDRLSCPEQSCGFVHWGNPTPVVAAVVEHEGEVILVRNHGWPEKWFGLVSGFLESQEDPGDGVLREIREEIGIEGQIVSLIGAYPFSMMNQVIIAYHVRATGEVQLGDEIAAYKRIDPDKLRPWPMGTGEAVKDWLEARRQKDT